MKSRQNFSNKNKRSSVNEFNDRNGLKPVKSKFEKSKRISIYDQLDDDDDLDLNSGFYSNNEFDDDDNDEDDY